MFLSQAPFYKPVPTFVLPATSKVGTYLKYVLYEFPPSEARREGQSSPSLPLSLSPSLLPSFGIWLVF